MGGPARITGWVCYCGQKLDGDDTTAWCKECSAKFERTDREIRALSSPAVVQPLAAVIATAPLGFVAP
jgi:hypothetical protein